MSHWQRGVAYVPGNLRQGSLSVNILRALDAGVGQKAVAAELGLCQQRISQLAARQRKVELAYRLHTLESFYRRRLKA